MSKDKHNKGSVTERLASGGWRISKEVFKKLELRRCSLSHNSEMECPVCYNTGWRVLEVEYINKTKEELVKLIMEHGL